MFVDDIWCATRRGDLGKVKEFIERDGYPEVEDDFDSQSLLTVACEVGNAPIVRFLIDGCRLGGAYEPYAFAALKNGHLEVLRVLLESGLDSDSKEHCKHGPSLEDIAVSNLDREAMKLFVEYGAELKYSWWGPESNEFGWDACDYEEITDATLLEMAAYAGRPDIIEFFLYAGAQVDAQSTEAYLKLAREKEPLRLEFEARHQAQEEGDDWQTVKYRRLDIGASPWPGVDANRIDENGDNLLFRLLQQEGGLKRRDKEFLRHIAPLTDLSITDGNGRTPWQIAQSRMEGGVALYLLNQAEVTASPLERCYLWGLETFRLIFGVLKMMVYAVAIAIGIVLFMLIWPIIYWRERDVFREMRNSSNNE